MCKCPKGCPRPEGPVFRQGTSTDMWPSTSSGHSAVAALGRWGGVVEIVCQVDESTYVPWLARGLAWLRRLRLAEGRRCGGGTRPFSVSTLEGKGLLDYGATTPAWTVRMRDRKAVSALSGTGGDTGNVNKSCYSNGSCCGERDARAPARDTVRAIAARAPDLVCCLDEEQHHMEW
jgi:hypothetical protein